MFATVRTLITRLTTPHTESELAAVFGVSKAQMKLWLARLIAEGVIQKSGRPVRY
ncbi:hypothetical protein HUU62_11925 [Rhodoferax sp. 4810]|uniref:Uncharacterized protein n=1 Tax=Thiospirillum jenense TaxID=1653858 RepID=A0A839HI26_9GAMM|nr:FaeA/PapI family transcriptional regulator [Thiospirillum jenense]MBB1075117.1 hypothetical protein [Rhodoferax jenense]MBB1126766.1 hypothetical protein [Thiospirillum jenense]